MRGFFRELAAFALFVPAVAQACDAPLASCDRAVEGGFAIVGGGEVAVVVAPDEAEALRHAAGDLVEDIARIGGRARLVTSTVGLGDGKRIIITQNAAEVSGWEAFSQQVSAPNELRITGADPRGAVFGIYDLSERIGVSPWYWWADVPPHQHEALWLTPGTREDAPQVRYRGFFINDEDPAFGGWAREKFGGVNAQAYEHVFELLLRLKGNYLWPAMWGKSLAQDDPASLALAADMGVVLGTSHHEPLTRAHVEWERAVHDGSASGAWNYGENPEALQQFWREGMERHVASGADAVVTIGMRGDGDEAMSEGTAIPLLERVVADQRAIIAETTGRPAAQTPQVWALYKEVQDYYDQGMAVPDDVILLFADDNWGQIRRLPPLDAAPRAGGYGVYYHFDYVGGPRSYKWIDTIQQGKTWQQMNLAWERGARDLWVVNVGDIKPDEYQLDFFMDMAWNPPAMDVEALGNHSRIWAAQQFGEEHAEEIAALLDEYARLASRRKPELVDAEALASVEALPEFAAQFDSLRRRLVRFSMRNTLPAEQRAAFFQLVEHRIQAMANLYLIHGARGEYGPALAMQNDIALTERYHTMLGGKWNHMMSQPHVGYTSWDDPDENIYPEMDEPEPETRQALVLTHAPPRIDLSGAQTSSRGEGAGLAFTAIPELGSMGEALVALPQGRPATTIEDGVFAEYTLETLIEFDNVLTIRLVPTLDTIGDEGIRLGLQWNDGPVEIETVYLEATNGQYGNRAQVAWNEAVIDNVVRITRKFPDLAPGHHRLRIYRIDDNLVVDSVSLSFALDTTSPPLNRPVAPALP